MKQFKVSSVVGSLGEKLARRYVEERGHVVLAENYYYERGLRSGEIDLITEHLGILHFIEVKTRHLLPGKEKSQALYFPITAQVTRQKIQKMAKTAGYYLRAIKKQDVEYHFDLITVLYDSAQKKAEIQYLQDIFY